MADRYNNHPKWACHFLKEGNNMNNTIFRQTWQQIHEQPLISIVSIVGTALSLFLIMLVVMMQQVKVAPFAPESNRDRMMFVKYASIKSPDGESNGAWSISSINTIYKGMKTPQAVSAYTSYSARKPLSVGETETFNADVKLTDAAFWKIFDFSFIDGKPYDEAAYKAGIAAAVIDRTTARRLFDTDTRVTGKTFNLGHTSMKVAGVVSDVSTLASASYAQVWLPLTVDKEAIAETTMNDIGGVFNVVILARQKSDFKKVHDEAVASVNRFNLTIKKEGIKLDNRNRPYDTEKESLDFGSNVEPDVAAAHRTQAFIFLILLIVPAINLSSMTHSRLRQRISEIGIRRAFGCTRWSIASQILTENMIVTLCAGVAGLLLSVACAYGFNAALFTQPYSNNINEPIVDVSILLHLSTFGYALAFCFVLNLLSTGIPAWHACRTSIINDLNGRE
jgi:putative ABC transport system permease protein